MTRHDDNSMTATALRELDAIDATLAGEHVADEHAPLARLASQLRDSRPRPAAEFVSTLDARAAQGFKRERHARMRRLPGLRPAARVSGGEKASRLFGRARFPLAHPAFALALVALLAAITIPLSLSGGGRHAPVAVSRGVAEAQQRNSGGRKEAAELHVSSAPATPTAGTAKAAASVPAPLPPTAPPAPGPRQVERAATLDVGVAPSSIQSTAHQVFTLVSASGGYVRQSNVSSSSEGQGGASFDLQIPSSRLSSAIASLSHLGHVRSENDTTNDVTGSYDSLRTSLGDARSERASLLKQLAATSDPERAAALKGQLHAVEGRISALEANFRALRGRIDYTSLALTLTPEAGAAAGHQGDLTPGGAARDAGQILQAALAVLVLAAAAVLPIAAIGVAAWVAIALTRRRLREQALDVG